MNFNGQMIARKTFGNVDSQDQIRTKRKRGFKEDIRKTNENGNWAITEDTIKVLTTKKYHITLFILEIVWQVHATCMKTCHNFINNTITDQTIQYSKIDLVANSIFKNGPKILIIGIECN